MISNWYFFSIMTLVLFGVQRFLYKVSAAKKCNTAWTSFSFMATVTVLSAIVFLLKKESLSNVKFLFFISLINSITFLAATVSTIEALKHIPTSIAYPLTRLNTFIVVIFSVIYFKDALSVAQISGIFIAICVIMLLTRYKNENEEADGNFKVGLLLISIALISGALSAISSKFAALYVNKLAFIALSYFMGMIFSCFFRRKLQGKTVNPDHKNALLIGFTMGIINFCGFYAFLYALSLGPLAVIAPLVGMYFIIAIILSVIIYHEKLDFFRITGIVLTAISIVLMKF